MSMAVAPPGYTVPPVMMQPSIMIQAPQRTHGLKTSQQKSMKIISALQVVMGVLCILVQSVLLGIQRYNYGDYMDVVGTGIWCGVLFVISGTLGFCAARRSTTCLIVANMVMSIISSTTVWCIVGFASATVVTTGYKQERCLDPYSYSYYGCKPDSVYNGYLAADSLLIIFSFAEFILAIWSSSLGCRAVCCCNSYSAQPVYHMTSPAGGQQVIFMPQQGASGQPMMVVSQQCLYTGLQAGNLQGQTTYMPTTGGVMPPDYVQTMPMMQATMQAGGDMEKQPLANGY